MELACRVLDPDRRDPRARIVASRGAVRVTARRLRIEAHALRARDPLPRGAIPSDDELRVEFADALAKKQRDELDRARAAAAPGELIEHATLNQIALDRVDLHARSQCSPSATEPFAYAFGRRSGLGNGLAHHAGFAA